MKHFALAVSMLVVFAAPAFATHSHPSSAKQTQTMFAAAYYDCTIPNTVHQPSLTAPACNPEKLLSSANPTNVTTFAPTGTAIMKATVKVVPGNVKINVAGKLIHNNGSVYTGPLMFKALLRITDHACLPPSSNPCTMVDFPLQAPLACTSGYCSVSTTVNTLIPGAIVAGKVMNIELGQFEVQDPDGDVAFRQGLLVP